VGGGVEMATKEVTDLLYALSGFAWPLLATYAFVKLYPYAKDFFSHDNVKIKFGTMELSAEQAAKSLSNQIEDLQNKVVQIEQKIAAKPLTPGLQEHLLTYPIRRGEKLRILWVDDFPSNNAIQIAKLMDDGYWIDVASITAQAIQMFEYTKYDLVISDMGRVEDGINKPNAGVVLTREIRTRDKNVPIVIFSTKTAIAKFETLALEAGANYLTNSTIDLYQIISIELGSKKNAN
jgi:CheY-like chemotaxis protein